MLILLFLLSCEAFNLTEVVNDILCVIPDDDIAGTRGGFVRLVFHDTFGQSRKMDGCIDVNNPAHGGLQEYIDELEPLVSKYHCQGLSRADIWAAASIVAISIAGGPNIPFSYGRIDCTHPPNDSDLLPTANQNFSQLMQNFKTRMGFSEQELTALSGAHSLGECSRENTGFEGQEVPHNTLFTNEYYRRTLKDTWIRNSTAFVSPVWLNQDGNLRFDTDMALVFNPFSCSTFHNTFGTCEKNKVTQQIFKMYAQNQTKFFHDFTLAFYKLLIRGWPQLHTTSFPYPSFNQSCRR
jgi:catalase (peroxidase I)